MNRDRVLLVDDDELSREILQLMLDEAGYKVVPASSGEEALEMLASGVAAEVMLSDLQMPGLSGAELAAEVRRRAPQVPRVVLAMSGSEPKPGSVEGYDGFLLKPFTVEQLASAITHGGDSPVGGVFETGSPAGFPEPQVGAEVLDSIKLEQLRASFRPEQLEELFAFALTDAERQLETMRQAVTDGDTATYQRCAHSMKGSFGMLGAPELWELARSAEQTHISEFVNGVTTLVLFSDALSRLRHTLVSRGICHS